MGLELLGQGLDLLRLLFNFRLGDGLLAGRRRVLQFILLELDLGLGGGELLGLLLREALGPRLRVELGLLLLDVDALGREDLFSGARAAEDRGLGGAGRRRGCRSRSQL